MFKFERLKPPYAGVTADSVNTPFLPFFIFLIFLYFSLKFARLRSAPRHSFDVLKEPILASDNMEWIAVAVTGQSFLLHQIRKMVSVAIDATRGAITDDKMLQLFSDDKLKTSIAPAQGLFLDMSFFERYSNKNSHLEPLDWHNEETPAKTRWADFKREKIINHMLDEESLEHNFLKYIYEHDGLFFREDSAYEVCEVEVSERSTQALIKTRAFRVFVLCFGQLLNYRFAQKDAPGQTRPCVQF